MSASKIPPYKFTTYISYTLNCLALKLESIELLHGGLEVGSCLKLHEPAPSLAMAREPMLGNNVPSAVGIAACLGVHHIEA